MFKKDSRNKFNNVQYIYKGQNKIIKRALNKVFYAHKYQIQSFSDIHDL